MVPHCMDILSTHRTRTSEWGTTNSGIMDIPRRMIGSNSMDLLPLHWLRIIVIIIIWDDNLTSRGTIPRPRRSMRSSTFTFTTIATVPSRLTHIRIRIQNLVLVLTTTSTSIHPVSNTNKRRLTLTLLFSLRRTRRLRGMLILIPSRTSILPLILRSTGNRQKQRRRPSSRPPAPLCQPRRNGIGAELLTTRRASRRGQPLCPVPSFPEETTGTKKMA